MSVTRIVNLDPLIHALLASVGANNHRQFVVFVITLVLGIGLFDYLSYACTFLPLTILRASSDTICHRLLSGHGLIEPGGHIPFVHVPFLPVLHHLLRHLPVRCRPLGHAPALVDDNLARVATLAGLSTNDHSRSLQSWPIRCHGRAGSLDEHPDGCRTAG